MLVPGRSTNPTGDRAGITKGEYFGIDKRGFRDIRLSKDDKDAIQEAAGVNFSRTEWMWIKGACSGYLKGIVEDGPISAMQVATLKRLESLTTELLSLIMSIDFNTNTVLLRGHMHYMRKQPPAHRQLLGSPKVILDYGRAARTALETRRIKKKGERDWPSLALCQELERILSGKSGLPSSKARHRRNPSFKGFIAAINERILRKHDKPFPGSVEAVLKRFQRWTRTSRTG